MQNRNIFERESIQNHDLGLPEGDASLMAAFNQVIDIMPGTADILLPELLNALREHLDMEIGFISQFKDGRREFLYVSDGLGDGPVAVGNSDPLEETYCFRIAQRSLSGLIPDARKHPELKELEVTDRLGIRTYAGVPIHTQSGQVFGTLCCYSSTPDKALGEQSVAFMTVIADLIGAILEREHAEKQRRRRQRESIRNIINSDGLRAVWQPIVDTVTGRIAGVESLARFNTQPYYPPNEWFDIAQNAGLGIELECRAIEKGLAVLPELPEGAYVACNVSGRTLISPELQDVFRGRDLSQAVLEITEHDIIDDYQLLLEALEPLRARGLRLSVDDFGNGHSSFQHIVHLEPDFIKLDRSLVRDIDRNANARKVLHALAGFAFNSGSELVAEGVETRAELEVLQKMGISRIQGYLLHKPLEQAELQEVIAGRKSRVAVRVAR